MSKNCCQIAMSFSHAFEDFPFMVGVWGWTCVCLVFLFRRLLVVVSSSIRCHWGVHSHCDTNPTFKWQKSRTKWSFHLPKSWNVGPFSCFVWKRVNASASFVCGKRSTFVNLLQCRGRRSILTRRKLWRCCCCKSQLLPMWWQVQDLVFQIFGLKVSNMKKQMTCLYETWHSRWDSIFVFCVAGARLCKLLLAQKACFGSFWFEKLRKPCTKCPFPNQVVMKKGSGTMACRSAVERWCTENYCWIVGQNRCGEVEGRSSTAVKCCKEHADFFYSLQHFATIRLQSTSLQRFSTAFRPPP